MENVHERFSWKVWVIILLGIAGILILFMVLPMIFTQKKNPAPSATTSLSITPLPTQITPTIYAPSYQTFNAGSFLISYPNEWEVVKKPIQNTSGVSWEIAPISKSTIKAVMQVQQYSSATVSFDSLNAIFTDLKFAKKQVVINGHQAVIFTGTMPSTSLQTAVMLVNNGSVVYKIQSTYESKQSNASLDKVINTMMVSFKLTNSQ